MTLWQTVLPITVRTEASACQDQVLFIAAVSLASQGTIANLKVCIIIGIVL